MRDQESTDRVGHHRKPVSEESNIDVDQFHRDYEVPDGFLGHHGHQKLVGEFAVPILISWQIFSKHRQNLGCFG